MERETMKAILEVEFDEDKMIDKETLEKEFDGDLLKLMKYLYKLEDMGIFENKIKLVGIKK